MPEQRQQATALIKRTGIIAIIRGDFTEEQIVAIGDTLLDGGVLVLEVTLNSHNALAAISTLRERYRNEAILIGAGTVRTAAQVDQAVGAGAAFIVSPNFDPQAIATSHAHGILHLPGVLTPTEAHNAQVAGCNLVKLFPADTLGPPYLKALRAPLNDIDFVPTGGVDVNNIPAYRKAGAVAVGIGGSLVAGPHQTLEDLRAKAQALRAAWDQANDDQ